MSILSPLQDAISNDPKEYKSLQYQTMFKKNVPDLINIQLKVAQQSKRDHF